MPVTDTNIYDFVGTIAAEIGVTNYQHGSFKSIQKYLMESLKNKKARSERFPILAFITQDKVDNVEAFPNWETEYPLRIIIADLTSPRYSNQERLDNVFKPVLIPIYNAFIDSLRNFSKNAFRELPHKRKDHFYYSVSDDKPANQFAFQLDAIELTDLNININFRESECISS